MMCWVQTAVWFFVFMALVRLNSPPGVTALTLERGGDKPREYIEIFEGETLTMNCSYSTDDRPDKVRWKKQGKLKWITINSEVKTDDSRVSVTERPSTYTIRIANISTTDSGRYVCNGQWNKTDERKGFVTVSVIDFPKDDPVCSVANATEASDDVGVWCDTMQGNPGVTVTWTIPETGQMLQGSVHNYTDGTGKERVRSQLRFDEHQRNQSPICTVTSNKFPGMNRTCSIGPIEAAGNLNVSAAIAVPTVLITGCAALIIILSVRKRHRESRISRQRTSTKALLSTRTSECRMAAVLLPYSVTQVGNPSHQVTDAKSPYEIVGARGGETRESLHEVQLDLAAGSSGYDKIPTRRLDAVELTSCALYATVNPDDDDSTSEESPKCARLYKEIDGTSSARCAAGASGVSSRNSTTEQMNPVHRDDARQPRVSRSRSTASSIPDEGMVDNPVYQPSDDAPRYVQSGETMCFKH